MIRAALDRHLTEKSSIFQAIFYYWRQSIKRRKYISKQFLKTLSKSGQIAPTMHKQPLTNEVVAKLYEGELVDTDSLQLHKVQQTAWFFISLFLGKRSREKPVAFKEAHAYLERNTKW